MKTKFKLIAGVLAAAALSTGIVASAATTSSPWGRPSVEELHMDAVRVRNDPEWIKNFEEALLEGKSPVDPVYAVYNEVVESDEIMPAYLSQVFGLNDGNDLTLVHDASEYGYNLWSGRATVSDVNQYANTFDEPETMKCVLDSGTSAHLENKLGFSVNYKTLGGVFIYEENGTRKQMPQVTQRGTGTLKPVSSTYKGSGKLIEKIYYFYVYHGDEYSGYRDVAVIHVVDRAYSETAEYAALPYGNLIDCYTYVDTDSLGVMPPVGAE